MKAKLLFFTFLCFFTNNIISSQVTTNIFNQVLFYDGYATLVNQPVPEGVTRFRNDLISRKLTATELTAFGSTLTINVSIKASCDNYDRIGNVNLALVPKNQATYIPNDVSRIELARFITPFMNYNIMPDTVPYTFNVDNMAKIFKDPTINALYDIWIELQVFGVPYAAQEQVEGCAGRNDVFYGTLNFVSNTTSITSNEVLIPLNFQNYLNNYQAGASDAIGQTTRTIGFNVASNLLAASLYLITSNHGANSGGEEYNRRLHYIDFDGTQITSYKPGETTCEPYRTYNTQGNGIYGASPRTNAQWQSFSNWCPGSKIPIRQISLGNVASGNHTFRIRVPTAVFANGEGYFPVSLYLQGTNTILGINDYQKVDYSFYPNPTNDILTISTNNSIESISITDILGKEIWKGNSKIIDMLNFENGIYLLKIKFENFDMMTEKILKN